MLQFINLLGKVRQTCIQTQWEAYSYSPPGDGESATLLEGKAAMALPVTGSPAAVALLAAVLLAVGQCG